MPKQPNRQNKEVSGVVYDAAPETSKTNSKPAYPAPPGYRIVYHVTKEIGDEMALFNSAPVRVYGSWLKAAAEYADAHPQNTATTQAGQLTTWTKSA